MTERSRTRAILHRLTPNFLYPRCPDCGRSMLYCIKCERLICVDCNHMPHILHMIDVYIPILDKVAGTHLWSLREAWNDIISLWLALPLDRFERKALAVGLTFGFIALIVITLGQWLGMMASLIVYSIILLISLKGFASIQQRYPLPDSANTHEDTFITYSTVIQYPCIFSEPSFFPNELYYTVSHTTPFVIVINDEAKDFVLQHDHDIYWVQFYAANAANVEVLELAISSVDDEVQG